MTDLYKKLEEAVKADIELYAKKKALKEKKEDLEKEIASINDELMDIDTAESKRMYLDHVQMVWGDTVDEIRERLLNEINNSN